MHTAQRIARNTALMLLKQCLLGVAGLVFVGYLARALGTEAWGALQASIALTTLVGLGAGIGVRGYLARETALHPERGPEHLGSALVLRGGTGLVLLGLTMLCTAGRPGHRLVVVAALSQLATLVYSTVWLGFEASERYQYILYAELPARALVMGLSVGALQLGWGVGAVALAFLVGNVLELGLTFAFARARLYAPRFRAPSLELWTILRAALPLGALGAILAAMQQSDRVLLGFLSDQHEVGIYSAAWVLTDNIGLLADLLLGTSFAAAVRLSVHDPPAYVRLQKACMRVSLGMGLPLGAGLALLAPEVIRFLYGEAFLPSIAVLRLLALQVPLSYALQASSLPLLTARAELALAKVHGASFLGHAVLAFPLLPRLGARGAALSSLLVTAIALLAVLRLQRRYVPGLSQPSLRPVALSSVLMVAVVSMVRSSLGLWGTVGIGASAYVGSALLFGVVSPSELRGLWRWKVNAGARSLESDEPPDRAETSVRADRTESR